MSDLTASCPADTAEPRNGSGKAGARGKRIGPYVRPAVLARMDGRTKEARLLKSLRAELTAHLGGTPTVIQRALIERAAQLSLRVALFDARLAETGQQTDHDIRTYLSFSQSLTSHLRQLGIKGQAGPPVSALEHLATRRRTA